jgi:hypothetical protein
MANLLLVRRHCFWDGFLTVQSPLQVLFNFCDHYPISRAVKRCIAGAEAAHAGFPVIEPVHFLIGVCKVVDLNLSALLDAAAPEWKEGVADNRLVLRS